MFKTALTSGLLLVTWVLPVAAADVTTGASPVTFPDDFIANTVTVAGTYYGAATSTNNSLVTVNNIASGKTWKVYARLTTAVTGLTVRVTNTGSGGGCAVTSNGTQTLDTTTSPGKLIFSCSATDTPATAVPLQFQVEPTPAYGNGSNKTFNVTYEAIEE